MDAFTVHKGIVATLDRANVDTDQIIAKQFLKSIKRTGFGADLFYDWRYDEEGKAKEDFSLNRPEFQGASILVAKNNFGCGSSREHAVWAIAQYGFRAVIAPRVEQGEDTIPGFADIFRNNCGKNGVLAIELSSQEVDQIFQIVDAKLGVNANIDLNAQTITFDSGESFSFEVAEGLKERLLNGLDDIGLTLKEEAAITDFESTYQAQKYY